MFSNYDEVLTVTDVAEILFIGRNTVYELLNDYTLRNVRIEGLRNSIIGNQLNSIDFDGDYKIDSDVTSYF